MKPDWSSKNVPDWAMYAAQELSGSYLWHEFKPTYLAITGEWRSSGRWAVVPKVSLRPEQTLEERPETEPCLLTYVAPLPPFGGYLLRDANVQQE